MTFPLLGCVPALQIPYLKSSNRYISLTRKHRHASDRCCGIFLGDTIHATTYETAHFAVSVPFSQQHNAYGCTGVWSGQASLAS